ncbi:glutathione S-transferase U17-like [Dioscorea cayenensis subsp. rotundata]|uniref:Glutathione S-transferase n=1 Tax=Dioscorea cayennensis subsp. rotundata TaxID=55577 RepID=A0AB40CF16_DIOCR|nr:glutathione S-transferase U17-like [Dioscorea cayenensis subsp. rotundata]
MAEEVKLIGLSMSMFVIRVKIALNLKGVKYENLEETFGSKSELLLKSNPIYKKVPVLIHNGKTICESMIIVQYVDDVWSDAGPSIVPSDPFDAAMARFWSYYIDDKWFPAYGEVIKGQTREAKIEAAKEAIATLQPLEEVFQQQSKGKDFFGGDTIGYLDIALGCYLGWIKAAEKLTGLEFFDKNETPLLAAWAECFYSNDAVKCAVPDVDEFVEFSIKIQAKLNA